MATKANTYGRSIGLPDADGAPATHRHAMRDFLEFIRERNRGGENVRINSTKLTTYLHIYDPDGAGSVAAERTIDPHDISWEVRCRGNRMVLVLQ